MALEFDGTDMHVDCGNNTFDSLSEGTLMARVSLSSVAPAIQALFGATRKSSSFDRVVLEARLAKPSFWIKTNNGQRAGGTGGTTLVINTEYLITLTVSAGGNRLYLNNSLETVTYAVGDEDDTEFFHDMSAADQIYCVGSSFYNSATPIEEIYGTAIEVRVYNRALTLAEIATIYYAKGNDSIVNGLEARWLMNEKPDGETATVASSVIDISGNGHHGTPANSPVYRAAPVRLVKPVIIGGA